MSVIGILGGGWLGLALASEGLEKGYEVRISATSIEKTKQL